MPTESTVHQPVCQSGHIQQQRGHKFCDRCGQPVIDACPDCGSRIMDAKVYDGRFQANTQLRPPKFCTNCGKPLPWAA